MVDGEVRFIPYGRDSGGILYLESRQGVCLRIGRLCLCMRLEDAILHYPVEWKNVSRIIVCKSKPEDHERIPIFCKGCVPKVVMRYSKYMTS